MRVLKTIVTLLVAGITWATGCAGVKLPDAENPAQSPVIQPIPDARNESDPVFLMLMAEVAGQRGRLDVSLDAYMRLLELTQDPRIAERATQVAVFVKDSDKAMEAAETWSDLDPKSVAAHRLALVLKIKTDEIGDAADEVRKLIELKDPEFENTLLELARWINEEKERERGLEIMRELVDQLPKVPEIHLASAYLASEEGALLVAREEVARAIAMRPGWSRALMLQAQLFLQAGDLPAGRAALEKAHRLDPKNPRLGLIYGQFLAKTGDLVAAERELTKVVDHDPGNDDARFALASVWMERGDLVRARKEFDLLSADQRWRSQADFSIALIDAREGRTELALREFDRINEGPMVFDARFNAISALIVMGRGDEARKRMAAARIEFPQEKIRLYLIEAELLSKQRQSEAAYALLTEGLQGSPGQPELLYSRALLAEQLNHMDVMEADLKALLEKSPDDAAALNALGFSLTVHSPDRLDEAEGYIRRAIAKRPGDPAILDSFGWVLFRQGKPQEALVPLKRAYALFPDPEIAAHLGEVLWVLERRAEARQIWQDAWKQDPRHRDMLRIHEAYPEAFAGSTK